MSQLQISQPVDNENRFKVLLNQKHNDERDLTDIINEVDLLRLRANADLDPKKKSSLGQFFTPNPIGHFMASLFKSLDGDIKLLEPGCGMGALLASFVNEAILRGKTTSIDAATYDIEKVIEPYLDETLKLISKIAQENGVDIQTRHHCSDFILDASNMVASGLLFENVPEYSHVIMNPPYKKIASSSDHRKALRNAGIETVNLYTGFVALAIKMLKPLGELVAIIPRSFCNGPYYQQFRELLMAETAIKHMHIFESRQKAFSDDDVLQENLIIHCIKNGEQGDVTITSSPGADFHVDVETNTITATDMTTRVVPFSKVVNPVDNQRFIHIAANERDQSIIDRLASFTSTLSDIGIEVSTGPVVDFRLKSDLREKPQDGAVPLLYPIHLNGGVCWPKKSKKPNSIMVTKKSRPWLWRNKGCFIITRRFSSKEEKRRIVATYYDSKLPGELIGFDNKLNVFHSKKEGFDERLAKGLFVYLNSTLVDKYYRLFGGHTQVNVTDLRSIHYPSSDVLKRIGKKVKETDLSQKEIDILLDMELDGMSKNKTTNPLNAQSKIDQALEILISLGMPRAQQNERSALTLLALLNLHPEQEWKDIEQKMMGVTPIMNWCKSVYGKEYAPNTRETFRRQTLHQFVDGGLCLYNPDKPDRPVNSPYACYQITNELYAILTQYGTRKWGRSLKDFLKNRETLVQKYAMERELNMIPLTLPDGSEIKLSAGAHSQLIKDIVTEFGPRFAPGAEVIYLGDAGAKEVFFYRDRLKELGVTVNRKGKLPDVVLYWAKKDWLLLIESVTTHGPVDGKRHGELSRLFSKATPGLVYVTAFPDRGTMNKYLSDISWETEVWLSEAPTHLIHFNGDRFLGPHK